MRTSTGIAGFALTLVVTSALAARVDVREIDTSGFDLGEVNSEYLETPMVIRTMDELYNAIADEEAFAIISQQVDFNTEFLLYFQWTGSSEDLLKAKAQSNSPSEEVTFTFQSGMTLDLSPHHHVFAVSKGASWRVEFTAGISDSK